MKSYIEAYLKENFMHNFAYLRRKFGISKRKMAELLKIGVDSINKLECGELPPRLSTEVIFRIEKCFGIEPKDLLGKHLDA